MVDVATITLIWRSPICERYHLADNPQCADGFSIRNIVVFNDDRQIALQEPPALVSYISTGGNLGYGGGNNYAIEWARAEFSPRYFLILNPDVQITRSCIAALIDEADRCPSAAIIGPTQLCGAPASRRRSGMRYFPWLTIIRPVWGSGSPVDYINGGAMLIRASAIPSGPVFRDDFFLFFEELELTYRLREKGYAIAAAEACHVLHTEVGNRNFVNAPDYVPEVAEYFENLNALRLTRNLYPLYIPSALIVRIFIKPLFIASRGDWLRLIFWSWAIGDFFLRRVRRFPFQRGWNPTLIGEKIIPSRLPLVARRRLSTADVDE